MKDSIFYSLISPTVNTEVEAHREPGQTQRHVEAQRTELPGQLPQVYDKGHLAGQVEDNAVTGGENLFK